MLVSLCFLINLFILAQIINNKIMVNKIINITHNAFGLADSIETSNTWKIVYSSLGLVKECVGLNKQGQLFNDWIANYFIESDKIISKDNKFYIELKKKYITADIAFVNEELQKSILLVKSYLVSQNRSTNVPLLNLLESKLNGIISLTDFTEGVKLFCEFDIYNIRMNSKGLSIVELDKQIVEYMTLADYVFNKLKNELIHLGKVVYI